MWKIDIMWAAYGKLYCFFKWKKLIYEIMLYASKSADLSHKATTRCNTITTPKVDASIKCHSSNPNERTDIKEPASTCKPKYSFHFKTRMNPINRKLYKNSWILLPNRVHTHTVLSEFKLRHQVDDNISEHGPECTKPKICFSFQGHAIDENIRQCFQHGPESTKNGKPHRSNWYWYAII